MVTGVLSVGQHHSESSRWAIRRTRESRSRAVQGTSLGVLQREDGGSLSKEGDLSFRQPSRIPTFEAIPRPNPGCPLQDVWDDIRPFNSKHANVSAIRHKSRSAVAGAHHQVLVSNENDIVLDAFCGCGTALVAAQNLGRQWIGIDVSPTACRVMAKRLRDVCRLREDENLWLHGKGFVVRDLPWTEKQLRTFRPSSLRIGQSLRSAASPTRPRWAIWGSMGAYSRRLRARRRKKAGQLDFMDDWYPIQVKQMDKVGRPDIDKFEAAMMRTKRKKGFFVGFDFSSDRCRDWTVLPTRPHRRLWR